MLAIIIFVLILSFLVFVHELGHFSTAKWFKVKVEEFGMGLPPKIWGKKYKGTEYSINALPLGGFVKIKGEDFEDYDPEDKHNFINKKPWQKSIILLAGIFMNLLIATLLFYIVLASNNFQSSPMLLLGDYHFKFGEEVKLSNVVTFIENDSPAYKAGVQFGDRIISVKYKDEEIRPNNVDELRSFLADKQGDSILLETININNQKESEYSLQPYYFEEIKQPALGVALSDAVTVKYNRPLDTAFAGFLHAGNMIDYSYFALGSLIRESVKSNDITPVSQGVSGPIGIFSAVQSILSSDTSGNKLLVMLDLTAILSLSLGVMNLLPIPALDGGRFMFVLYEWITKKKPSRTIEAKVHQIGYLALMALLIVITIKDIVNIF